MHMLAEALQNFFSANAVIRLNMKTQVPKEKFNNMVYFEPIMHHSAFAFHSFLLAPDTD